MTRESVTGAPEDLKPTQMLAAEVIDVSDNGSCN
jgi:hypothetical protein